MSSYPVRMLTDRGLYVFRAYLQDLRDGSKSDPPRDLLFSVGQSEEFIASVEIEQRGFRSRIDFCEYLAEAFGGTPFLLINGNERLWSWLSLFFFDQVCPVRADGWRRPGMHYRHILSHNYRHRHRHLLEGAYNVYHLYGMDASLMLCSPVHHENAFHHELAGRQGLISNPVVINVATELYYDIRRNKPKPGSLRWTYPGTLRRYVDVINQLDMTFDLFSMQPKRLKELLPAEFDHWKAD